MATAHSIGYLHDRTLQKHLIKNLLDVVLWDLKTRHTNGECSYCLFTSRIAHSNRHHVSSFRNCQNP